MATFQEEVINDIRQALAYRIGKLNAEP